MTPGVSLSPRDERGPDSGPFPVTVVGMGMGRRDLTAAHLELIDHAQVLAGGRRHLAEFPRHPGQKIEITRDLDALADRLDACRRNARIVVLASGDPLFYGIGAFLARRLGTAAVRIHPNVTAVAAAFSRLREPWQDAPAVSLHGRAALPGLIAAVTAHPRVAVFTDRERTPAWVARALLDAGFDGVRACVFERMGDPAERVRWFDLAAAAQQIFAEPNLVVLARDPAGTPQAVHLGIPDERFEHEKGLITKLEVRAVSLAFLRLMPGLTVWDLGAGCGSVAVEAARLVPDGRVVAVEQAARRVADIRTNARRFGAANLTVVEARLPDGLDDLPDPDRVFVGGGGRRLPAIVAAAARRLKPAGGMVINTVLIPSLDAARSALADAGLAVDSIQIQASRERKMPWGARYEAHNPVWIITGYN